MPISDVVLPALEVRRDTDTQKRREGVYHIPANLWDDSDAFYYHPIVLITADGLVAGASTFAPAVASVRDTIVRAEAAAIATGGRPDG